MSYYSRKNQVGKLLFSKGDNWLIDRGLKNPADAIAKKKKIPIGNLTVGDPPASVTTAEFYSFLHAR